MSKRRGKKPRAKGRKKQASPKRRDLDLKELKAILARARTGPLSEDDFGKLDAAVDTLAYLTQELDKKGVSIQRLRKLIFGASTEKTSQVTGEAGSDTQQQDASSRSAPGAKGGKAKDKTKRKGHGRNGAAAYTGAEKVTVAHESLQAGDPCPECPDGKLYPLSEPAVLVRVTGMAPLNAVVYEKERLRCNLCGIVFTAKSPDGVGTAKYDESAAAMVALLKYGTGMPFNRLERLQRSLGIPLPASTQWDIVRAAADKLNAVYEEVVRQAAQGGVLHNDDTTARILDLMGMRRAEALAEGKLNNEDRTGIFTSGIVSTTDAHKLALFFTGTQHAGENLAKVLAKRAAELGPPIQMSDALSRNQPGEYETLVANCLAHSRRRFVEVAENFPEQVRHILLELREVYKTDASARKQQMSAEQRLALHQKHSGPVMERLKGWLEAQIEQRKEEPNSSLGEAIGYMHKHWDKLTLFLSVPGAPLDNNIVERALKRAIQHRKNSLFYRSENGAKVGDLFMTLIYSAELNDADPFDYLVALLRHTEAATKAPGEWLPWRYRDTLAEQTEDRPAPS